MRATREIMDRMLKDHIVAYGEPVCVGADMHCVEDRVGKERMKESYAYRTMNEMGLRVPLSSDCPVDSVNPIDSAYIAVNRKDLNGWPEGGWYPEERLTIDQVLKGFTLDSAYAQFQEDVKGSIEAGKYADFVVLSGDPTAIDPNAFNTYSVIFTDSKIQFLINDRPTHSYPRLRPDREDQFPFKDHPFYVILSAQLGGSWVGDIDLGQLPVMLEIDYVRFYSKRK